MYCLYKLIKSIDYELNIKRLRKSINIRKILKKKSFMLHFFDHLTANIRLRMAIPTRNTSIVLKAQFDVFFWYFSAFSICSAP